MKHALTRIPFVCFVVIALANCGGGGGGGGSSTSQNSIIYEGRTGDAVVTRNNAETLSVDFMLYSSLATDVSTTSGVDIDPIADQGNSREKLVKTVRNAISYDAVSASVSGADVEETERCDRGDFVIRLNVNQNNGAFNGSINFRNCFAEGLTFNGKVDVKGKLNTATFAYEGPLLMEFKKLTVKAGASLSMAGDISCEFTPYDEVSSCESNLDLQNDADRVVYRLRDFVEEYDPMRRITMTASFFHPDYGRVRVGSSPLSYFNLDRYPYYGLIVFAGSSEQSCALTFSGAGSYTLLFKRDPDAIQEELSTGTLQ